jgi:hypothetical protein
MDEHRSGEHAFYDSGMPEHSGPHGVPKTKRTVSSGWSPYWYEFDATCRGILHCCPEHEVAWADPDGGVHCASKGERD